MSLTLNKINNSKKNKEGLKKMNRTFSSTAFLAAITTTAGFLAVASASTAHAVDLHNGDYTNDPKDLGSKGAVSLNLLCREYGSVISTDVKNGHKKAVQTTNTETTACTAELYSERVLGSD